MKKPSLAISDLYLGVFSIVFFSICWIQVGGLAEEAQIMPHIVILLGCLCAVGVIVKALCNKTVAETQKKTNVRQAVIGILSFLIITLLMRFATVIGMYVCTYLSILTISLTISYFEHGWNGKQMLKVALFDLVVLGVTYLLFGVVLKVNTPKGFLF
ncbi:MAG: tripartite tricarboxylate transporter TctB family protein [Sphaerochaetaceae bacterium]|nr:tripartite tricarboxylate transporter TctB family protein [Spirochaetales bacterium]MDY5499404.1 tripartite tricarboxylate transporter TctB family protein [Sphaerochaetaceae bacterium]